jgi:hypothetical protein
MTRIAYGLTRAPAVAIARCVRERGAVYSSEILFSFGISESTLRRRRPALRRLGITFIENGAGSIYATDELAREARATIESATGQLPSISLS